MLITFTELSFVEFCFIKLIGKSYHEMDTFLVISVYELTKVLIY